MSAALVAWLWLAAAAFAQDAPAETPAPDAPAETPAPDAPKYEFPGDDVLGELDVDVEIDVIGDRAIKEARADVIAAFAALGWRARQRADGRTMFRAPAAWAGRAALSREGELAFSRPFVAFQSAQLQEQVAVTEDASFQSLSRDLPEQRPLPQLSVSMPERRKVEAAQARALASVQPSLLRYRAVIAANQLQLDLQSLGERLDALWKDGAPLAGDATLPADPSLRRRALLAYWATRTATPEGRAHARAVEVWFRNTLFGTAEAPTEAELVEAEAARGDGRRFPRSVD